MEKMKFMKLRYFKDEDEEEIKRMISELDFIANNARREKQGWPKENKEEMNLEQDYSIREEFTGKNKIIVAEDKEKIIGFCWLIIYDYGPEKVSEITQIFTEPAQRNKGVGKELIKKAKKLAKEEKVNVLLVATTLNEAKNFYENLGFTYDQGYWLFWVP